tara:strand:+ start:447 stop:1049 length:603 start_codon:yes stop_codon:yes gene_type:complete
MSQGKPAPTPTPKTSGGGKNDNMAMMLIALGGALKGDEDFVKNTLAIQGMQEGKKKKAERKKRYDEMMEKMDTNSPLYEFSKVMGSDGIDKVAQAQFDLETRVPKKKTATDYVADIMAKVKTPGYVMTEEDKRILQVSRKADPATMMIEDIQAEAIKSRLNQTGGQSASLQTFASTAAAIAAGLKPGDQYLGSDGNTYRL